MSKYTDVLTEAEKAEADTARRQAKEDGETLRLDANDAREAQNRRWDTDDAFWRIDTWTPQELADNARWSYYVSNPQRHASRGAQ